MACNTTYVEKKFTGGADLMKLKSPGDLISEFREQKLTNPL